MVGLASKSDQCRIREIMLPNEVTDSTKVSISLNNKGADTQDACVKKKQSATGFALYSNKPNIFQMTKRQFIMSL